MLKKIVSIFLAALMMLSVCIMASAKKAEVDPIILVHGMMGNGENALGTNAMEYWGMSEENSIVKKYRAEGYTVYAPSVGPMSSAWDRACELFAQLTGTVVDYGAAHSKKYGHDRYGRDYTGKGFLSEDWYKTGKINLVSHSFGGPAVIVFTSLMAYGSEEEKKASPNDCSPLFEGNHGKAIHTVTTLESPSNGSTIANVLNDTYLPVLLISSLINIEGTKEAPGSDYMLDQFGVTADPSTGKTAKFNPLKVFKLSTSRDHCAYDMSLQGARKLCETYQPSKDTYYFSVAANMMVENKLGMVVPGIEFNLKENVMALMLVAGGTLMPILAGKTFHGVKTDKSWSYGDGLVPVPSARYPYSQAHVEYDGTSTDGLEKGVWHMLPVVEGESHGYAVSGDYSSFWTPYFTRLRSLSRDL